jgi:hypothetical protein
MDDCSLIESGFLDFVWKSDMQFSLFGPERYASCALHTVNLNHVLFNKYINFAVACSAIL